MAFNSTSTYTVQNEVDKIRVFAEIEPIFNVGGYSTEPALTIATDVMTAICAVNFPHKWNDIALPDFYTNSWQQDYALINPDGTSVMNVEWLERGVAFDINNTAIPKPWVVIECGRQLPQRTGTWFNSGTGGGGTGGGGGLGFIDCSFPNYSLYYGTWGAGNVGSPTLGNNPTSGSIYINPLSVSIITASWLAGQITFSLNYLPAGTVTGSSFSVNSVYPIAYNNTYAVVSTSGTSVIVNSPSNPGVYQAGGTIGPAISQPANPITQIIDANGNFLVLTTYGTEGTTAPLAGANAVPGTVIFGTGATTRWTVIDPNGLGIRILNVPSQTGVVWQHNIVAQKIPVRFTSLQQTLNPLPDKYEPFFRAGMIAQCYRYSPETKIRAKFKDEWEMWLRSLTNLRETQDRELEENKFVPNRTIMGAARSGSNFQGAGWPFGYPRW
jgi:hypothetical protein